MSHVDNSTVKGDCNRLSAIHCAELANDRLNVLVDGSFFYVENLADFPSRLTLRHPCQNLELTGRERVGSRLPVASLDDIPFPVAPGQPPYLKVSAVELD